MKTLHMTAFIFTVIGGLNWGLIGFFQYNLVESIVGQTGLINVVYTLIGLSAAYLGMTHKSDCKICSAK